MAGKNFGCGSSREHAVWALDDFGFRVVIAPSFADIFANNCVKNGVLTVVLKEQEVEEIIRRASESTTTDSPSTSSNAKSTTIMDSPPASRSTSLPAIACSMAWMTSDSRCSTSPRLRPMKRGTRLRKRSSRGTRICWTIVRPQVAAEDPNTTSRSCRSSRREACPVEATSRAEWPS